MVRQKLPIELTAKRSGTIKKGMPNWRWKALSGQGKLWLKVQGLSRRPRGTGQSGSECKE